jgi:hypothetical protein
MNPEPGTRTRDEFLREMLVRQANSAGSPARTALTRRAVIATVAAFTVAGGLAGGAVSAVALANDQPATNVVKVDLAVQQSVLGDAQQLGTPFTYTGDGVTILQLGEPPEGATDFFYRLRCLDAATYVTVLDDDEMTRATISCDRKAANGSFGGGGGQLPISDSESHSFTVQSDARYSIWGTWAAEPTPPEPSAAQTSALADGAVTREEYVMAYERFSACLSEAGFPLAFVDLNQTVIQYSTTQAAETDGASPRCYVREFQQIDIAWQIANEDTSETARVLGECLLEQGITPGSTMAEKLAQLEAAGMTPPYCSGP